MNTIRILFTSGAKWSDTGGGQRYQQLLLSIYKNYGDKIALEFYAYQDYNIPDILQPTFKDYDCVIVGFPPHYVFLKDAGLINPRRSKVIYDVCDAWWSGEMIAGADLTYHDRVVAQDASALVAVNPQLLAHYLPLKKPYFIIPNGLRREFLQDLEIPKDNQIHCYWWGTHFHGQTWVNLETLQKLPYYFPNITFHYYFASSFSLHELFPVVYPNMDVKVSFRGILPEQFLSELRAPAIGIIPFNHHNMAAFYADPIKIYEYWAAGLTVVAVNTRSSLGERPFIFYRTGNPLEACIETFNKILSDSLFPEKPPPKEERIIYSWECRAKEYVKVISEVLNITI